MRFSLLFAFKVDCAKYHRCLARKRFHVKLAMYTAISRKVVGKHVHATIPKGNVGYVQYTVPDTVAVEPTFVSFL